MIFVLTKNYQHFQSFMYAFQLREDFPGQGCTAESTCIRGFCRRGQVAYLGNDESDIERRLRGMDHHNIVLAWGPYWENGASGYVQDFCKARYVPFIVVPELMREKMRAEMTPLQRQLFRGRL
jgi:hypothetical protein